MVYALNSEALLRQMEAYRHKLDPCPVCGGQVTCSFRIPNHMTKNPNYKPIDPKCLNMRCPSNVGTRGNGKLKISLPPFQH